VTAWARRLGALALLAAIVVAALLAFDIGGWRDAIGRGDARYRTDPKAAQWRASAIVPGDPARSLLAVADDLRLRDALRLYAVARATPEGFDNGQKRAEIRAHAEVALAEVTSRGSASQASVAANLLGVLLTAATGSGAAAAEERARASFDAAIRADPTNEDAKYNLELLLRRQRIVGTRAGHTNGSGARGASRRGAGAGTPGSGY
jgi:hypothetical protein